MENQNQVFLTEGQGQEENNQMLKAELPKQLNQDKNKLNQQLSVSKYAELKRPQTSGKKVNKQEIIDEDKADLNKLKDFLDVSQSRKRNKDGTLSPYNCKEALCDLEIGSHGCCSTQEDPSDIDQYGVGITLYFRFIKHIGLFYLLFFLLSIPQLIFSLINIIKIQGAQTSNYMQIDSLQNFLMSSTLGTIGIDNKQCSSNKFLSDTIQIYYSCTTGYLDFSKSFKYGLTLPDVKDQTNCLFTTKNDVDYRCSLNSTIKRLSNVCDQKTSCNFTISKQDIDFQCEIGNRTLYSSAFCFNSYIDFQFYKLPKAYIPYILAAFDFLVILLFIFMLISLRAAEKHYLKLAQIEAPQIQYFTVQFSNLPQKNISDQKLIALVWNHLEDYGRYYIKQKQIDLEQEFMVWDIKISESQEELILRKEISERENELNHKLYRFIENYGLNVDPDQELDLDLINTKKNNIDLKNQKKANKKIIQFEKYIRKTNDLQIKLNSLQNKTKAKYLWATFYTQQQALVAQEIFSTIPSERMMQRCCPGFQTALQRRAVCKNGQEKKLLETMPAPNPDNIIWENIYYSDTNRFFRTLTTLILTIAILIGSFILICYIRNQKDQIISNFPQIDCSNSIYSNITEQQIVSTIDQTLKSGFINCYCKSNLRKFFENSLNEDTQQLCQNWFQDYSLMNALPLASVCVIIVINVIIQFLFTLFSQFEKHDILAVEYASRIIKIFLAQFFNTALILLITNISFGNSNKLSIGVIDKYLFGGKYDDINPEWYLNVGTVLLLTILINTATIPLMTITTQMAGQLRLLIDRNCRCSLTHTRQSSMMKLKFLYLGPEFMIDLRYALILNITFVCMIYSAGMPLLYVLTGLTILFVYWIDKVWLFVFYRKPQNFNETMSQYSRNILWLVTLLHCGFAIYIYGSQDIFFETAVNFKQLPSYNLNNQGQFSIWWNRAIGNDQNLIFIVLIFLLLIGLFFAYFFIKPIKELFDACAKFVIRDKERPKDFYKPIILFLNPKQLYKELQFEIYTLNQNPNIDPDLREKKMRKIEHLKNALISNENQIQQLQGLFSYDFAYSHKYSSIFDWSAIELTDTGIQKVDHKLYQTYITNGVNVTKQLKPHTGQKFIESTTLKNNQINLDI